MIRHTKTDIIKSRIAAALKRYAVPLLCFGVPAVCLVIIYCFLEIWPAGENSVLVLDLNAQYIYYFEEFRRILTSGDSILYSFKRALGGEFMGIFAYYLSSPFSFIVALFPKDMITEAMYLILVLKTGCCGLSFGHLIGKKVKTDGAARVMLGTMYALSAWAVVMQHNVMWLDNLIAFPLILCGVDALITEGKFRLYVISLVYSIVSNFYLGYMTCLFVALWFFARYFMLSREERNPIAEKKHFIKSLGRILLWSLTAVGISAVILIPTYYSLTFGKLDFTEPDFTASQMYEFADLLTKAFFGSYDSVRPTGMPFIYCGTLVLILVPLYFVSDDVPMRRKIGFGAVLAFLAVSFNLNTLDVIWHGMQKPNWLNARFAYMFIALELYLAAEALVRLKKTDGRAVARCAVFWAVLLIILDKLECGSIENFKTVWSGLFLFAVIGTAAAWLAHNRDNPKGQRCASLILCTLVVGEMTADGILCLEDLDEDCIYANRHSYRQMLDTYEPAVELFEDDDTFYRAEKLVHRKKNDNLALGINGMSNSTSTLNARAVNLLSQFGYSAYSHWSMYSGATAVTDALFGIKYVMTDETDDKPIMQYIYDLYDKIGSTDTHIDVYENPYSLSIAYAVNSEALDFDPVAEDGEDKNYTDPFTYMNKLLTEMTGENTEIWTRVKTSGTIEQGVSLVMVPGHRGYVADGDATPKISYTLEIESTDSIYMYFPSDYPRDATLKIDGKKQGKYFDGEDFSIREIGSYEIGSEAEVSLYLDRDEIYIKSGVGYFWYFNEEAFVEAISKLTDGTMEAYSDTDDTIYGTITVPENRDAVMTTIPYDEGWVLTVDGEETEYRAVLNGTLIGFEVSPGQHEIRLEYKPTCVTQGIIISSLSLTGFIAACVITEKKKARAAAACEAQENM